MKRPIQPATRTGCGRDLVEGGYGRVPLEHEGVQDANGERRAAEADDGGRSVSGSGGAEHEADGDGDGRGDVTGQGTIDADVHEGVAGRDAGANLDDGAGGAAEGGRGQNPGQGGANLVPAAGEVMAELVNQQNAEQGEGKGPADGEEIGVVGEPGPGPEVAVTDDRRHAFKEVLHEARAVGGGGEHAGAEQQERETILPEGRRHSILSSPAAFRQRCTRRAGGWRRLPGSRPREKVPGTRVREQSRIPVPKAGPDTGAAVRRAGAHGAPVSSLRPRRSTG